VSRSHVPFSFWLGALVGVVAIGLAAITPVWPEWIEVTLGVDPDRGFGTAEWLVVALLFAVGSSLVCVSTLGWRGSVSEGR
jgi:hypothetical protein